MWVIKFYNLVAELIWQRICTASICREVDSIDKLLFKLFHGYWGLVKYDVGAVTITNIFSLSLIHF